MSTGSAKLNQKFLFSLFATLIFFSSWASAQTILEKKLDQLMKKQISAAGPGAAVFVMKGNEVLFKGAFGLADIENQRKASAKTNFRLASVSKIFTATAILMLVEKGQLQLKTPLTEIFPNFPEYGKNIKVSHLLSHTSGIKEYFKLPGVLRESEGGRLNDANVLSLMMNQAGPNFKPGSSFKYTNSGYAILAEIVAKVSGKSYARFLHENIFKPAGMQSSFAYERNLRSVPSQAFGYLSHAARFIKAENPTFSHVLGDGGIYSSLDDLIAWSKALNQNKLISSQSLELAAAPTKLSGGGSVNYGLGWRLGSYRGLRWIYHTGTSQGFRNIFVRIPSRGLTLGVLTNLRSRQPQDLAQKIFDIVHADLKFSGPMN